MAARINAEHDLAQSKEQQAVEHYRKVGLMLLDAKKGCVHGEWTAWLKKNVKFSQRSAVNYMALANLQSTANLLDDWRRISGNERAENGEAAADASAEKQGLLTQNGVTRTIERTALASRECYPCRPFFRRPISSA
jgi:hypothetical protein